MRHRQVRGGKAPGAPGAGWVDGPRPSGYLQLICMIGKRLAGSTCHIAFASQNNTRWALGTVIIFRLPWQVTVAVLTRLTWKVTRADSQPVGPRARTARPAPARSPNLQYFGRGRCSRLSAHATKFEFRIHAHSSGVVCCLQAQRRKLSAPRRPFTAGMYRDRRDYMKPAFCLLCWLAAEGRN